MKKEEQLSLYKQEQQEEWGKIVTKVRENCKSGLYDDLFPYIKTVENEQNNLVNYLKLGGGTLTVGWIAFLKALEVVNTSSNEFQLLFLLLIILLALNSANVLTHWEQYRYPYTNDSEIVKEINTIVTHVEKRDRSMPDIDIEDHKAVFNILKITMYEIKDEREKLSLERLESKKPVIGDDGELIDYDDELIKSDESDLKAAQNKQSYE